jgi:alpha-galactosidase
MKYLADYVHSKGLKLGIYSCAGNMTCGRRFGGYGYEEIDAKTYAEWGIDLLKYDYCYAPWKRKAAVERYTKMGTALKNSGRDIVFSVCEWGIRKPWLWAEKAGGSYWRTTPDIFDVWDYNSVWRYSLMHILKKQKGLEKYAGPGHWNDPDMLTVGNYGKGKATSGNGKFSGMTDVEYQSEMSLWCMLSAPLLASCDLRTMNEATKSILMNPDIIAINQDKLGEQAKLISTKGGMWVYLKNLEGGNKAVAILNTSGKEKTFELSTKLLDMEGIWNAYDVWQHKESGLLSPEPTKGQTGELVVPGTLSLKVKPHETVVLRLEKWVAKVGY